MSESSDPSTPSRDQTLELAEAMLRREGSRIELAREAFRRAYPAAPEPMITAAVFHVYVDGIDAAMHWLADAEEFLRDPTHRLSSGRSAHLLYHVYNWHQLESLMPCGRSGLLEMLDDISQLAEEGDKESIKATVDRIRNLLTGHESAPDFH